MPVCASCGENLSRKLKRCHECGACSSCCICEECDDEDYNPDTGGFDRDELGMDPEED